MMNPPHEAQPPWLLLVAASQGTADWVRDHSGGVGYGGSTGLRLSLYPPTLEGAAGDRPSLYPHTPSPHSIHIRQVIRSHRTY